MVMALERRIAFAVFAIGLVVVVLALVGCGEGEPPGSESRLGELARRLADPCSREGMAEHGFVDERVEASTGRAWMLYLASGSATPCAARVEAEGSELRVPVVAEAPEYRG
jgi:hypothetical protein